MLPTSVGVESVTSRSSVRWRIQLRHRGRPQPIRLLDLDWCYKFTDNVKHTQCRSGSVGFFLIWIYTVCKCRVYSGSATFGTYTKNKDPDHTVDLPLPPSPPTPHPNPSHVKSFNTAKYVNKQYRPYSDWADTHTDQGVGHWHILPQSLFSCLSSIFENIHETTCSWTVPKQGHDWI